MLRKGKKAEDVVILPESAAQPIQTDQDLVVMDTGNEETMLDLEGFDLVEEDSSVPTIDLDGNAESFTEELVFDEGDEFGELEATQKIDEDFLEDDDEIGMQTEPLEGVIDADATMLEDEAPMKKRPALKRGAGRTAGKAAKKPAAEPEKPATGEPIKALKIGAGWIVFLAVIAFITIIGALMMYDYATDSLTGVTEPVAKNFSSKDKDGDWKYHKSVTMKYPEVLDEKGDYKFTTDDTTSDDGLDN